MLCVLLFLLNYALDISVLQAVEIISVLTIDIENKILDKMSPLSLYM